MSARKTFSYLAAVAALLAGAAHAQSNPWTTVGSAGTVDDTDTGIVDFFNGEARVRAVAAADSVLNLRYNVIGLPGFDGPGSYDWRVRFRDNGSSARVQLNLRRYNHNNGASTALAAFDSNNFGAAAGYQTQTRCISVDWDFNAGPHYIEATLTKSGAAGTPAVGTIQLVRRNLICPVILPL